MANINQVQLFDSYAIISEIKPNGEIISSRECFLSQAKNFIRNYGLGFMLDDGDCKWYW